MDANTQHTINSFRQLFPGKFFPLTFSKIPHISLTAVKFPDVSKFSRQVVTLKTAAIVAKYYYIEKLHTVYLKLYKPKL